MNSNEQALYGEYLGRTIGGVTIVSFIGAGATSAVFSGFQRTLKRQVAVKVLPKATKSVIANHDLFMLEAELVAQLHHQNIVPIYEMGEDDQCYYQIVQLVSGEDLQHLMQRTSKNPIPQRKKLPLKHVIEYLSQVLDGLAYAHAEGVVHRDIKPGNILIDTKSNRPLITDFGLAITRWSPQKTNSQTIEGSPLYMAPEYVRGAAPTAGCDIYATGIILYQLIVGALPLTQRDPFKLLQKKYEHPEALFDLTPRQVDPAMPFGLERIIQKAIDINPLQRYQTAQEFKAALRTFETEMHTTVNAVSEVVYAYIGN